MKRKLMLAFNQLTPMKHNGKSGLWATPYPQCVRALYRAGTDKLVFLPAR